MIVDEFDREAQQGEKKMSESNTESAEAVAEKSPRQRRRPMFQICEVGKQVDGRTTLTAVVPEVFFTTDKEALAFIEAGLVPGIYAPVLIYPAVKVEEVVTTVRRLQAV